MYGLIYSRPAKKQLEKLPREIQERIIQSLERIRIRPEVYVEKLVGVPCYKLRVGDYRVILDLENDRLLILVIKIGHRRNVYS